MMETVFSFACQACGMSPTEAAQLLKTPVPVVKSWCSGLQVAPEKAIAVLLNLSQQQNKHAQKIGLDIYRFQQKAKTADKNYKIVLNVAMNDQDAQIRGWPCASAYNAIIRRIVERMPPAAAKRMVIMPFCEKEFSAVQDGTFYRH